jgi:hypothetical protein
VAIEVKWARAARPKLDFQMASTVESGMAGTFSLSDSCTPTSSP